MKNKLILLILGVFLFSSLASSQFIISPRTLDEYYGSFPQPVHFTTNLTHAEYRIANKIEKNYTITIEIRGYSYRLGSGRTVKSSELLTTSPSGSFTLPSSVVDFPFLIEDYLPPDLDRELKAEVVLSGGNHTETISITMGEETATEWFEETFYSGQIFDYDIHLTYFNAIIIGLALLVAVYLLQK